MAPAPLPAPKLRETARLLLVKSEEVRCSYGVVALRANAPPTSPKTSCADAETERHPTVIATIEPIARARIPPPAPEYRGNVA